MLFIAHDAYALMVESHLDQDHQSDLDYERACEFMRFGYPM